MQIVVHVVSKERWVWFYEIVEDGGWVGYDYDYVSPQSIVEFVRCMFWLELQIVNKGGYQMMINKRMINKLCVRIGAKWEGNCCYEAEDLGLWE